MASRDRRPLADVPNAVNSPMRSTGGAGAVNPKRPRAQADVVYGQPPTKRQALDPHAADIENVDPRTATRPTLTVWSKNLDEPFSAKRPSSHSQPTAFERKLASVRKPSAQPRIDRTQKQSADNLESVRQWQKHYRRQFPQFVFYFDGVPEDVKRKLVRKIHSLGAGEDRFFSKAVTHVVTTRAIPAEPSSTGHGYDEKRESSQLKSAQTTSATHDSRRTTNLLDANLQRRSQPPTAAVQPSVDNRKLQSHGTDSILLKARALGTKIWALEKLHRVLDTILDTETADNASTQRSHHVTRTTTAPTHDADLEQLLRHEKVRGPADRDMSVATQDSIALRGYFIYVHDMDERTKPVMVRDYPKPENGLKELGKWPQFRLSAAGRCPFVEDTTHAKRAHQEREREAQAERNTRAGTLARLTQPNALAERAPNLRRSPRKLEQANKVDAARAVGVRQSTMGSQAATENLPAFFNSTAANMRAMPRMVRGEPVASGVQPSNITSAIRSQAISSAAISSTAPGLSRRAGDSKEVSLLKRRVLASGHPSSYVNDMRGAINDDQGPPPRAAKRKAQETLGVVQEDMEQGTHRSRAAANPAKRNKTEQKEPKPGYCENCRDKFDDFDEVSNPSTLLSISSLLTTYSTSPRVSIASSL